MLVVSGVGKKIAFLRKKQKLTQQQLADLAGFSRQTFVRWETGKTTPTVDNLEIVANFLNTTLGYLLGGAEDSNKMESNVHFEFDEPPEPVDTISIPVLSPEQTACCGKGIPSAECTYESRESVKVQKKLVGRLCDGKMPFAIIAEGGSMEKWGIEDGSRVVINPVEEVHDFDIVLVCYKDNLALKKVQRRPDGSINLLSGDGSTIMVTPDEADIPALFAIWGKAMYYRQVRAGTIKHGL